MYSSNYNFDIFIFAFYHFNNLFTYIKDFDDNIKNVNLIYTNYINEYITAGGANKDGANIRIATRELEKRNEKQKILFVLSDGMPSAYQYNGQFAIDDVKSGVKEARDEGIEIISIEPSKIFSRVIRILKDIFKIAIDYFKS